MLVAVVLDVCDCCDDGEIPDDVDGPFMVCCCMTECARKAAIKLAKKGRCEDMTSDSITWKGGKKVVWEYLCRARDALYSPCLQPVRNADKV